MGEQLEINVNSTDQKVQCAGVARSNPSIVFDYRPPLGAGEGYTPLELLLMSLAVCSITTVVYLLRKMKKNITGFNVNAKGIRRDTHPTSFEQITLEFKLDSSDTTDADMQKALKMSEETYCPVWAMLKSSVEIKTGFKINS